jgi:hypothetical protein
MRNRINRLLSELNFRITKEELCFDKQNMLELLYNFIVISVWRRHQKNIGEDSKISKILDIFLVFLTLCIISICILGIPFYFAPDPLLAKITTIMQLFLVLLIASICWGGVVYLSQEFRYICQKKLISEIKGADKNDFLIAFFNGVYFENPYGRGFRLYLRSIFLVFLMVVTGYTQLYQTYSGHVVLASFNLVFLNHNFVYFPVFVFSLYSQLVVALTVFIIFFYVFSRCRLVLAIENKSIYRYGKY